MEKRNNSRGPVTQRVVAAINIIMPLILLTILPACTKKPPPDEKILKVAIERFDKGLIETFLTLKSDPLQSVASENEIGRNDSILIGYIKKKKYMESEVFEIKIEEIKGVEKNKAEVEALERWRWREVDLLTNKELKPWIDEEFRIHYKMMKDRKKGWIVDSTKIMSRTVLKK